MCRNDTYEKKIGGWTVSFPTSLKRPAEFCRPTSTDTERIRGLEEKNIFTINVPIYNVPTKIKYGQCIFTLLKNQCRCIFNSYTAIKAELHYDCKVLISYSVEMHYR